MGKMKRIIFALLCLIIALTLSVFAACEGGAVVPPEGGGGQTPEVPDNPDEPDVPDEPEVPDEPQEIDLKEFIARAYNAAAENFTLSVYSRSKENGKEVTRQKLNLIYDAKNKGCEVTRPDSHTIYKDGLKFEKADAAVARESGGDGSAQNPEEVYYATHADEFPVLKPIEQRKLEALLELLGASGKIEFKDGGYSLSASSEFTEKANGVLKALKADIDETAMTAARDVLQVVTDKTYTLEETEKLIVKYGDGTLEEFIASGEFISQAEFIIFYNTVAGLLSGSYKLPSYADFMKAYGGVSLCSLLGRGSAADLTEKWRAVSLRQVLSAYKYGDGTLADFFAASDLDTAFTSASYSFYFKASAAFVVNSAELKFVFKMQNVPVFTASLVEGGLKREVIKVDNFYAVGCAFSDVGKSAVEKPSKYAVVGQNELAVTGGGDYTYAFGSENKPLEKIEIVVESAPIEDASLWAETLKKIKNGLSIDFEKGLLTVTDEAYGSMTEALKLGMTRLTVKAYEKLDFVLNII